MRIGKGGFFKCAIEYIDLPSGLLEIGESAFGQCESLKSITIPSGVTNLERGAFQRCTSLRSVIFQENDTPTTIGGSVFAHCSNLVDVVLPAGLVNIGSCAFFKCTSLTTITIPAGVTYIGEDAFSNCMSIKTVYFLGDAPTLTHDCFEFIFFGRFYYPQCNPTWTISIMNNYGGLLLWIAYMPDGASHSYGDWSQTKAPTCTSTGTEARECHCGATESRDIAPLDHTPGPEATCTSAQSCTVCGAVMAAALGHSYETVTAEPTCTVAGSKTYTCRCGDTYREEIPAAGHSYDSAVTAPTCTENGYTTYTCHCGDTYTEEIPAGGHSFVKGVCEHCHALEAEPGDVNGDGRINARDAHLILRYVAGLVGEEEIILIAADYNGDGRINARDARALLRQVADQA